MKLSTLPRFFVALPFCFAAASLLYAADCPLSFTTTTTAATNSPENKPTCYLVTHKGKTQCRPVKDANDHKKYGDNIGAVCTCPG